MKVIPFVGEERVRAAILKDLLPWALGWEDPSGASAKR